VSCHSLCGEQLLLDHDLPSDSQSDLRKNYWRHQQLLKSLEDVQSSSWARKYSSRRYCPSHCFDYHDASKSESFTRLNLQVILDDDGFREVVHFKSGELKFFLFMDAFEHLPFLD
jgi:hypothetical protein